MTSANIKELPYRDCVGVALFNKQGKVFIAKRLLSPNQDPSKFPYLWQMPQGGIDKGETPYDAAHRELFEETSVKSANLIYEAPEWLYYDFPDYVMGRSISNKYRGQRQRWFAFLFEGDEAEINLEVVAGDNFHQEFDSWRWEDLSNLPDLVVPFKRDVYNEIVSAFAHVPAQITSK